jgi:hypothetical protein
MNSTEIIIFLPLHVDAEVNENELVNALQEVHVEVEVGPQVLQFAAHCWQVLEIHE